MLISLLPARHALAVLAVLTSTACTTHLPSGTRAVAEVRPTDGYAVSGTVTFTQHVGAVWVEADFRGLTPNTQHGFHVHERGDCSAGDALSAGDHFNPDGASHGSPEGPRHAGDLPNLASDANGRAQYRVKVPALRLDVDEHGIGSRSVIVHLNADDYRSQPAGNAGARIGCGVIDVLS